MTAPADASETWLDPIFDAVISNVQTTGYFDKVNAHEPKRRPVLTGLTAGIWVVSIDPLPTASGLDATSARVVFNLRLYQNMLMEPQDLIDPRLTKAASSIMRSYHDNFDFGLDPLVRNVDLLGHFGVALALVTGYLEQDNVMNRIVDITLPLIINDVWPQIN